MKLQIPDRLLAKLITNKSGQPPPKYKRRLPHSLSRQLMPGYYRSVPSEQNKLSWQQQTKIRQQMSGSAASPILVLFSGLAAAVDLPSFTERFRMKGSFNPTCDRHGHLLTGLGGSPQAMEPFVFPTAEDMSFLPGTRHDWVSAPNPQASGCRSKQRKVLLRIRKILVPVDSERTKPVDLKRVVQLVRRLDAQITLLHCYEAPRSFSYAKGDFACDYVIRHRERNLVRLRTLCSKVRRLWPKCLWLFEEGSLPASILRVSKSMRADLIIMPVSLDAASENWSTPEVVDELARKAGCPVLAGKAIASES